MRIVHLATSLQGGAGIAALRTNNALNLIGEQSTIISRENSIKVGKPISSPSEISLLKKFESSTLTVLQSKLIQKNKDLITPWSVNVFDTQNLTNNDVEIIHIHAYFNFLNIASLRRIIALGKPTIFTLHDQRLFTGGCHYSRDCTGFQDNCASCPQVRRPFDLVIEKTLSKQKSIFAFRKNIEIVAPSRWIGGLAKASSSIKDLNVHVVKNPIPKVFFETSAYSQRKSRNVLRVAFIATNLQNPFKDLWVFTEAINKYSQVSVRPICVVLVGQGAIPKFELNVQIESHHPKSEFDMAKILSTIDLLIVPSNQDNSPSVIGEALAAGTPVIGSNAGGIPEILQDFDMPIFSVGNFNQLEAIIRNWRPPSSRAIIREKAKKVFGEEKLAREMVGIYRQLQDNLMK